MYKLVDNGKQYEIICKGARDANLIGANLTTDKVYETLNGIEAGIFADRPFVSIVADDGKKHTYHASRFEVVKELF